MDFGLAFSFVFKDRDWLKKIAIMALVGLIPIIGQIVVYGWAMNIAKRVMDNDPNPLADLDFGGDLSRGFMGFVISFVYSLPVILVSSVSGIFDSLTTMSDSNAAIGVYTAIVVCFGLVALVFGLILAVLIPAALCRYLDTGSLSSAFDFGEVFKLVRLNIGTYLIVLLGTFVAGIAGSLGFIACVIGVMLTYAYSLAVTGHLYGQAYAEATRNKMIVEVPPAV